MGNLFKSVIQLKKKTDLNLSNVTVEQTFKHSEMLSRYYKLVVLLILIGRAITTMNLKTEKLSPKRFRAASKVM